MYNIVILLTVANQVGGMSVALSPDGSSSGSLDQLHIPESSDGCHAGEKNEPSVLLDRLWHMTSDKQPVCSGSLLFQSPYYDPHVAFTARLFTPIVTSSPYFAAVPPPVCRCDCDHIQAESVNSHPITESSPAYTMPVPSDAVLVRPRMPLVAGKHAGSHETSLVLPGTGTSFRSHSSAVRDAGSGCVETESNAVTVYGGGFSAPPAHLSPSYNDELTSSSFSCCPHCGASFPAAVMPRNIIYHPTGPSYVIHSFTPTLQPCYEVTVNSGVARPPPAPATYTAGVLQSSVLVPDGVYQQNSTRPPLLPHQPSASLSFIGAAPSLTAVRVRTARPPPSCANCGGFGHTQLDCKEPTIDTVLNTRE